MSAAEDAARWVSLDGGRCVYSHKVHDASGTVTLADGRAIRATDIVIEQGVVHARIALQANEIAEIEWDEPS